MKPTDEQAEAIRLFKKGDSLAIEAGAGTGKTSTLVLLAEEAEKIGLRGQYVAFNKALVEESKTKFPLRSVRCNTAHSLAYGAIGHKFQTRMRQSQRVPGYRIAASLGIAGFEATDFKGQPKFLQPGLLGSQVMKTVQRFCQSADREISYRHVPRLDGLDDASMAMVRGILVDPAKQVWDDLQKPYGWVPFRHEHYLKMFQLDDPMIASDYILFDEAQDANPVIAAIIAANEENAQIVYVGDSQQEIYAWTGAVNALAQVEVKNRSYLTQSFRFGQAIADRANEVLEQLGPDTLRLTGNPAIDSRLERLDQPKAVLVRKNATGLASLINFQKENVRAHFIGGTDELLGFVRGAQELMLTGRSSHPDLVCFDSWSAVQDYVRQDEGGEDLRLNVRLIDGYGVEAIEKAITTMPFEGAADVVISTAHRAKGREWQSVQINPDFPQTADSNPADLRLLYVAITRAKEVLDVTALDTGDLGTDTLTELPTVPASPQRRLN